MRLVKIDASKAVKKFEKLAEKLSKQQVGKAMSRAMNRATYSGRTVASRLVRNQYKIKKSRLDSKISRITAKANNLTAELNISGSPIKVSEFKYRQGKRGVFVKIGRRRSLIPGAFVATMKSGHTGVFARGRYADRNFAFRKGRVKRYMGGKVRGNDLPITALTTLSEGAMFGQNEVIKPALARISEIYERRLEHEIAFLVAGLS